MDSDLKHELSPAVLSDDTFMSLHSSFCFFSSFSPISAVKRLMPVGLSCFGTVDNKDALLHFIDVNIPCRIRQLGSLFPTNRRFLSKLNRMNKYCMSKYITGLLNFLWHLSLKTVSYSHVPTVIYPEHVSECRILYNSYVNK